MTLRKWGYLFWTSLLIGTIAGMLTGAILKLTNEEFTFLGVEVGWYDWVFMIFGASMISVLSQMGFFAYLTLRFIAKGFFRSKVIYWTILQGLLVAIALIDLVYFRYTNYEGDDRTVFSFMLMPLFVLVVSLLISYWKVKETNKTAFIPTLFFMSAITIVEAIPAFSLDETGSSYAVFMIVPLLVCNAWQIMQLHRILPNNKELTS